MHARQESTTKTKINAKEARKSVINIMVGSYWRRKTVGQHDQRSHIKGKPKQ